MGSNFKNQLVKGETTTLTSPANYLAMIRVVGVGGGGVNAVNRMIEEGLKGVEFVAINTDSQALLFTDADTKLDIGREATRCLGAGANPVVGRTSAADHKQEIEESLKGSDMVFVTAGEGGGTGTGAAPVIAKVSKDMGILTVGIVTIPFRFEGNKKIDQALDGVEEMSKHVDALLVINNERLREIYPEMSVLNAFGKADDTLSVAAKSIAEIITVHGLINLDFNDVKTVLKDGGVAIMSTGYGEGEGRVKQAIEDALNSPLLNDNDIYNSKKILLSINFSSDNNDNPGLTMEEMSDVNEFMSHFGNGFELKWGLALDPDLDKKVKVTILATGFGIKDVEGMDSLIKKHSLEEAARIAEQEEHQMTLDDRRGRFYGGSKSTKSKRRPHIYIFSQEDLDNEDIILAIENTPTYKRTKQMIKDLKATPEKKDDVQEEEVQGVISFV